MQLAPNESTLGTFLSFALDMCSEVRELRLGPVRSTAAAQAWDGWRASYMDVRPVVDTHAGATQLEQESIHGGRCEVFRYGRVCGPVYHLDFASQYPSICSKVWLPTRLVSYRSSLGNHSLGKQLESSAVIASVCIKSDEPLYPVRYRDELIFPVGRFTTQLCGPELRIALERGHIERVGRIACYATAPILARVMDALLAGRGRANQAGNRAIAEWYKAMANSLVGCFARRGKVWEPAGPGHYGPPWSTWIEADMEGPQTRYRSLGGFVEREVENGFGAEAVPAVASWVYSEARVRLLNAIERSGWEETHYADTDALMVTAGGYGDLLWSGQVKEGNSGQLRLVGNYQEANFIGRKHYRVDNVTVCAGVPLRAERTGWADGTIAVNESVMRSLERGSMPCGIMLPRVFDGDARNTIARSTREGRYKPQEIWQEK